MLAKFETFSIKDFKNSRGIYLINTPITSISIQKTLELKFLDYFYIAENSNLALIEQNSIPSSITNIKTLKSISTTHDTKSDWQIIRKFSKNIQEFLL